MLFVVSTGRSGSQTVATVLSQSPDLLCLHEPHPQLVAESAQYRYGRLRHGDAVALLRRSRPAQLDGRRYGETNNRLALLLPPLLEAFPDAQVVHLLRDGRDYAASELQRGAYRRDVPRLPWRRSKWDRWRLAGDAAGAVTSATWAGWSPFERICWQWGHVNRLVADDLAGLGPDRTRVLRIEDLPAEAAELCAWLGVATVPFVVARANARRAVVGDGHTRRHPNAVARVTGWEGWTAPERETFVRHCGDVMDAWYPGWRAADGTWQRDPGEPAPPPSAAGAPRTTATDSAEEARLRHALAVAEIAAHERASELAHLQRSPRLLVLHLGLAVRDRLRPAARGRR